MRKRDGDTTMSDTMKISHKLGLGALAVGAVGVGIDTDWRITLVVGLITSVTHALAIMAQRKVSRADLSALARQTFENEFAMRIKVMQQIVRESTAEAIAAHEKGCRIVRIGELEEQFFKEGRKQP
jgi:uncharacterized membrane protein (Fun14 family)